MNHARWTQWTGDVTLSHTGLTLLPVLTDPSTATLEGRPPCH